MCFSLTSQLQISGQFLAGLNLSVTGQLVVSSGCSGNLPKSQGVLSSFSRREFNVAQYKITVQQFANANINVKAVVSLPEPRSVIVKEPFCGVMVVQHLKMFDPSPTRSWSNKYRKQVFELGKILICLYFIFGWGSFTRTDSLG
ncbi:hypothetical protein FGIG_10953 [Fasciola gigantica]|uniref:Uncharacterized protein n=1 Tax=Fasciola gigantica TaxID=46835 RepID=A0A504YJB9_FASGI|nr:hypothetical protein FGIG_10953 [Fasciola gigantica]